MRPERCPVERIRYGHSRSGSGKTCAQSESESSARDSCSEEAPSFLSVATARRIRLAGIHSTSITLKM
eukprot:4944968-Pleurochrysis_carterae.AAC.2